MSIWGAFGFVALGMALAHLYDWRAWCKYYEGKRERRDGACSARTAYGWKTRRSRSAM